MKIFHLSIISHIIVAYTLNQQADLFIVGKIQKFKDLFANK